MQNEKLKIVFFGTPEFGAIILEKLCQSGFRPILVISASDKPVGRKHTVAPPPVKILAQKYGIPVLQPKKILNLKFEILNLKPDLIITAAYAGLLPKDILDIPKYGCLNVHPSLLPKYRGPSPIQSAILNDDEQTGVTIMKMIERLDAGPVVGKAKLKSENLTYMEAHNALAVLGADLLIETIPKWIQGEIKTEFQDESKATYTEIIKKEDGRIDWKKPAEEIERQIRAFNPWPSAFTGFKVKDLRFKMVKILKASILEQTKNGPFGPPGKTFLAANDKIAVQTGKDFLIIEQLQIEGKKSVPVADFLKGHLNSIGTVLR